MAPSIRCVLLSVAAAAVVLALLVLLVIQGIHPTPPLYYASVNSVSGVGDDWGRQPLLFFLTLGVKSRSPLWRRPCIDKGTVVEVAYHGVDLMYGTENEELCTSPWELVSASTRVIWMQRSNVSGVPEFVVQGLAEDASRGVQVFDVTMRIPSTRLDGADDGKLVSCMSRQVGVDNSMSNACDAHYARTLA